LIVNSNIGSVLLKRFDINAHQRDTPVVREEVANFTKNINSHKIPPGEKPDLLNGYFSNPYALGNKLQENAQKVQATN
jgi:hypothetical protein